MQYNRLFLVSCVKCKRDAHAPAADLYTSPLFVKARCLVERAGAPWFILSAKHGLLAPGTVVAPYERTLTKATAQELREWADKVISQMDSQLPDVDEVVVLAGKPYRKHLMPYLENRFRAVSVPMTSLRIGEQLQWLDRECYKSD